MNGNFLENPKKILNLPFISSTNLFSSPNEIFHRLKPESSFSPPIQHFKAISPHLTCSNINRRGKNKFSKEIPFHRCKSQFIRYWFSFTQGLEETLKLKLGLKVSYIMYLGLWLRAIYILSYFLYGFKACKSSLHFYTCIHK